jgi:hypothetical protein
MGLLENEIFEALAKAASMGQMERGIERSTDSVVAALVHMTEAHSDLIVRLAREIDELRAAALGGNGKG